MPRHAAQQAARPLRVGTRARRAGRRGRCPRGSRSNPCRDMRHSGRRGRCDSSRALAEATGVAAAPQAALAISAATCGTAGARPAAHRQGYDAEAHRVNATAGCAESCGNPASMRRAPLQVGACCHTATRTSPGASDPSGRSTPEALRASSGASARLGRRGSSRDGDGGAPALRQPALIRQTMDGRRKKKRVPLTQKHAAKCLTVSWSHRGHGYVTGCKSGYSHPERICSRWDP